MSAKLCSKPGCGAIARIGYPCTDWDCPQDVVSANEYRTLLDALAAKDTAPAEMAKKLEQAEGARDHYLSNWKEAAEYLRIETFHAETAEAALAEMRVELERIRKQDRVTRFRGTEQQFYEDGPCGKIAALALGRLKDGEAGL